MNFRQFLSAAASAAILLTSVTVPNATAETAVIELEPNTRVSVTVTDPQTTTAVTNEQQAAAPNFKVRSNVLDVDQYENAEIYFDCDDTKGMDKVFVNTSPENGVCIPYTVKYEEQHTGKTMYKIIVHGCKPGTQQVRICPERSISPENTSVVDVTVHESTDLKVNGELKLGESEYGKDGVYTVGENGVYEIDLDSRDDRIFADIMTSANNALKYVHGVGYSIRNGTWRSFISVHTGEAGTGTIIATDSNGNNVKLTVNVEKTEPTVTTAPDLPVETTTTTTMRYADGGDVGTAPDTTQEYVPTETVTTCVTTTRPGGGTDGWNPPPYMTTTAVSNVLIEQNNDKLRADKYNVTVDQYGNAEVYFEKTVVRYDRLYTSFFDNDNIASCASVSNDYKNKTFDGPAYKLLIHGNKPGTTKAFVQDEDGNSCIINITVKAKDAPVINNKLKFLEAKEGEEYTVDISGHDYKCSGVLFKDYPDYIFAQVIEGNDDLTFGLYTSATAGGAFRRVEISTYGNGTYKVLFTDSEGNNAVAAVNVSEAPYADPNPYPGQPVGSEVPDLSGETTYTTTYSYADGGNVGTAPMTTEGFVLTTTTGTTPAPVPAEEPTEDFGEPTLLGDVDLSGDFGLSDVTTLAKYLLSRSSYTLSREAKANADINRDKILSSLDISILIEMNLDSSFIYIPVPQPDPSELDWSTITPTLPYSENR